MTIENRMHLIPPSVIDCATELVATKNQNIRLNYIVRLETIRDYCDEILKKSNESRFSYPPRKNHFSK
jgi:hypothetical protein